MTQDEAAKAFADTLLNLSFIARMQPVSIFSSLLVLDGLELKSRTALHRLLRSPNRNEAAMPYWSYDEWLEQPLIGPSKALDLSRWCQKRIAELQAIEE